MVIMETHNEPQVSGVSFDQLLQLNHDELEAFRQREVDRLINHAPPHLHRRLRGLQFQVDARRRIHTSPLGACISISQMMQESLAELHRALSGDTPDTEEKSADIIALDPFTLRYPPDQSNQ